MRKPSGDKEVLRSAFGAEYISKAKSNKEKGDIARNVGLGAAGVGVGNAAIATKRSLRALDGGNLPKGFVTHGLVETGAIGTAAAGLAANRLYRARQKKEIAKSAFGVSIYKQDMSEKKKRYIEGGSAAGTAVAGGVAGAKLGAHYGKKKWHEGLKESIRLSHPEVFGNKPPSHDQTKAIVRALGPNDKNALHATMVSARSTGKRAGIIAGAGAGATVGLEAARHFTNKKKNTE